MARITPETHRGQLISYFYLSGNLSFALGPYFGVLLLNWFPFTVLFLVCACLSAGSLLITLRLGKGDVPDLEIPSLKLETLLAREAVPPAVVAFMLNVIWGTLSAFIPLYALKRGISNPGIFFVFLAITLILGRMLGGRLLDVYDRKRIIFPCLITIVLSLILLVFSGTSSMLIVVAVILGTGWAFIYPSLMIFAIEQAGLAQGLAMGTFTAIADLGAGIGPMIMDTTPPVDQLSGHVFRPRPYGDHQLFLFLSRDRKEIEARRIGSDASVSGNLEIMVLNADQDLIDEILNLPIPSLSPSGPSCLPRS